MLTAKERRLVNDSYFLIIRETDRFVEFMSRNTKHMWILNKSPELSPEYPILIYHKHSRKQPYYHRHWQTYNFEIAIKSIKSHDDYVLKYNYH